VTPPRVQIGSLFLSYAMAGVFWGAFAAAAPEVQARSGLDAGGFGLALGAMTLTAFPVMQVFGRVVTRIAPHAIPLAMTLFAAGCLMLAMADGLALLILAFAILGGASGALDIALNLRTARVEEDTGARLFNRTHAVFPFAMLLTSAAVGWLRAEGATVATIFPAVAAGFLLVAAIEWRAGRGQQRIPSAAPGEGRAPLAGIALLLGAMAALGAFQEAAPQNWAAIFMETVRDSGPVLAGLAPAAFTLGLTIGRLVAHEIEHRVPALTTVRAAACLAIAGFAALALPLPEGAVLAVFLLAGMGVGPIEPAVFRAVARRTDEAARGRSLATVTSVAYMGYLLSPPILGGVAGGLGWGALWSVAAVAAATVVGLSFALRRA
jgi:MFS family permease